MHETVGLIDLLILDHGGELSDILQEMGLISPQAHV